MVNYWLTLHIFNDTNLVMYKKIKAIALLLAYIVFLSSYRFPNKRTFWFWHVSISQIINKKNSEPQTSGGMHFFYLI